MRFVVFVLALMLAVCSCSEKERDLCYLKLTFKGMMDPHTRSSLSLPDTNDFILMLEDASGGVVYSGYYGDKPGEFALSPGSYVATVYSREFHVPAFDAPQFGDEVCFMLNSGQKYSVDFNCTQTNSGVRINVRPGFVRDYDGGVLFLTSAHGKVMYSYAEERVAYFFPGPVSLKFDYQGEEKVLFVKTLAPGEILDVNLDSGNSEGDGEGGRGEGMFITVDTTRVWTDFDCLVGGDGGGDADNAITVDQARWRAGDEDVWVTGYVVGGDLTSSGISFAPPFKSYTNLAIASDRNQRDRDECMSVSLPAGPVRDALNLVDNPGLLGRRIKIKGDIVESYFGIPGIKNVSEYEM